MQRVKERPVHRVVSPDEDYIEDVSSQATTSTHTLDTATIDTALHPIFTQQDGIMMGDVGVRGAEKGEVREEGGERVQETEFVEDVISEKEDVISVKEDDVISIKEEHVISSSAKDDALKEENVYTEEKSDQEVQGQEQNERELNEQNERELNEQNERELNEQNERELNEQNEREHEEEEEEEEEPEIELVPEVSPAVPLLHDEHGNELDREGEPIIRHAFPSSWVLQPDEGDGVMRWETEEGPVRFIMSLEGGIHYPAPPNIYNLELDVYLKHTPTSHRISHGCEFFVDTGEWRLQLDSEVVNLLLRMDIVQDFQDETGETLWNTNKDITIENLTKAMYLYKDSVMDGSPVRWLLAEDTTYNPKEGSFRLVLDSEVEHSTRKVVIPEGMELVRSTTSVNIPSVSETEVRDVKFFNIPEDSVLEDQGTRHLDSGGCRLEESYTRHRLVTDILLEDQGTRHLLPEDCVLEEQGRRHLQSEGGHLVDITREVRFHPEIGRVVDITRGHVMCEDSERVDIKRHDLVMDQHIVRTPARWDNSHFDGEVVDLKRHDKIELDIKYIPSPTKFNLNQLEIEIDDDFLSEMGEEDV